ncbi:MAG: DUF378 domain-containing protein [Anaerotignaceae bacterium]
MKTADYICLTLVIIGALNWGLIGFFNFDLVSAIFGGSLAFIARIIFAIVGLAGLYSLSLYGRMDYANGGKQLQHSKK